MPQRLLNPPMKFISSHGQTTTPALNFDEFFEAHWDRVNGVLFRLVGDADETQDLALEAFWRLNQQYQASRLPENPSAWLYRVALNLGYNALRDRRRRQAYEQTAGQQMLQGAVADPGRLAEQAQERAWVRQVLASLPERTAQLLVLRHSGLSYAEIAAALKLAPGSVGTLLARAEREFAERYRRVAG